MWEDRELQRRRLLAIEESLKDGEPVADGRELLERLRKVGFPVTQPSISRDLEAPGTVPS